MSQSIYKVLKYFFAFTICAGNASSVPFIKKCHVEDANCMLKSTQDAIPIFAAGIPELGVSVLDPIYFDRIDGSTANLKLILNDVQLRGLKGCVAKNVQFHNIKTNSKNLIVKFVCSVEMNAQYEMKGQLLVPVEGMGKTSAVINNTTFNVDCVLNEVTGNNEKKYLNVKSCTHTHEFKPNSKVYFDNLFPENKVLAQAAREVIESNPDVIVSELGPPIVKKVIEAIIKDISHFAANVPLEDLVILN